MPNDGISLCLKQEVLLAGKSRAEVALSGLCEEFQGFFQDMGRFTRVSMPFFFFFSPRMKQIEDECGVFVWFSFWFGLGWFGFFPKSHFKWSE